MEIELKFTIPDEKTCRRLREAEQLAGFQLSPARTKAIRDRYLDTAGLAIKKAGYSCRTREYNGTRTVTLKQLESPAGGVHKREEFEVSLAADMPPAQWPESAARDLTLQCAGNEPLIELFDLQQVRLIRCMCSPSGRAVAELYLDEVRVPEYEGGRAYYELEIELLPEGTEHDLAAIQQCLESEWSLKPQTRSKFERAFTLMKSTESLSAEPCTPAARFSAMDAADTPVRARSARPRPRKPPRKPGLKIDDTMAEGARKTLYFHFRRMLYHEPGTRLGQDIEELHDMRVATRRMRAAIRVFVGYLDRQQIKSFAKDLRRAGRSLGAVRDFDVFREKTQVYIDTLPPERKGELEPLLTVLDAEHQKARTKLLDFLDSERYIRFKKRFSTFLRKPGSAEPPANTSQEAPLPHRIRHILPIVLYQRLAAVRAFEEPAANLDVPVEQLHRLRIAFKGLRYTLEFFREALGRDAEPLIEEIKLLQDHLGALQDAVVTCDILREFLNRGTWGHGGPARKSAHFRPVIAPGVVSYLAARQTELQRLLDRFPDLWEKTSSRDFTRRIASLVAPL
jgi:CHAD domain-containing protein/uncharacterized protein YjbK